MKKARFTKCIVAIAVMMAFAASFALADTQHVVKRNESLYGIAYQYNITAEQLLQANPQARTGLRQGMVLTIPGVKGDNEATAQATEATAATPAKEETPAPAGVKPEDKPTVAVAEDKPTVAVVPEVEETTAAEEVVNSQDEGQLYFVKKGDTLKTISQATGLSMTALMQLNPFVDPYELVAGTPIRLSEEAPMVELGFLSEITPGSKPEFQPDEPQATAITTHEPQVPIIIEDDTDDTEDNELADPYPVDVYPGDFFSDDEAADQALGNPRNKILIMLPFMSSSETQSKQAQQYSEFYRGFLLAANQLSETDGMDVEIIAIDLHNDAHQLAQALNERVDSTVAVIIAPEEDNFLKAVIDYSTPKGAYVYNAFNLKDENYLINDHVLQGYINQDLMYQKAINGLLQEFQGYTPVILSPEEGRTEKDPFVNALSKKYEEMGVTVYDLPFEGTLSASAITEAEFIQPDCKYVFIPRSGALGVFNRFAPAIVTLKEAEDGGDRFALFGYPDWTAFRGDAVNRLYQTNAVIYTRFFYNEASVEAKDLQQEYQKWYGDKMKEAIPVQGVLGYDTGNMLIKWLQESEGQLQQMLDGNARTTGIQSSFSFDHGVNYDGYINNQLYIVKFLPSGTTYTKVL